MSSSGALPSKDVLLAQVRKLNDKAHASRSARESALLDRLHQLRDEHALCRETLVRLRNEKGSADYIAAKSEQLRLEQELQQLQFELDPSYEFAVADAAISAAKAEAAAERQRDAAAFARLAKEVDDRLHKKTGRAEHPKAFDNNAKQVQDVISRRITSLGESDPSLLTVEWTRFDYKAGTAWKVPKPSDGLAAIAQRERAIEEEERMRQRQLEQLEGNKPPLDLSFGVGGGYNHSHAQGREGGTGRSASPGQSTRAGHRAQVQGDAATSPRSTLRMTSRTRTLPAVPSATVTARQLTLRPVPTEMLDTLSPQQLKKPRHPAYLLDSEVHHAKRWRKTDKDSKAFSVPPRMRGQGLIDGRQAARLVAPDRNQYHPKSHGKKEWQTPQEEAYPLFSKVPLDRDWIQMDNARRSADLEAHFNKTAHEAYEGEDAFEGGEGGAGEGDAGAGQSAFTLTMSGEPSLGYVAAQRYATRKAALTAALRPPVLGAALLEREMKREQDKLSALAARIGTARSGTGHAVWSKDDAAVARVGSKMGF